MGYYFMVFFVTGVLDCFQRVFWMKIVEYEQATVFPTRDESWPVECEWNAEHNDLNDFERKRASIWKTKEGKSVICIEQFNGTMASRVLGFIKI